jgi:hypothetical protein
VEAAGARLLSASPETTERRRRRRRFVVKVRAGPGSASYLARVVRQADRRVGKSAFRRYDHDELAAVSQRFARALRLPREMGASTSLWE